MIISTMDHNLIVEAKNTCKTRRSIQNLYEYDMSLSIYSHKMHMILSEIQKGQRPEAAGDLADRPGAV